MITTERLPMGTEFENRQHAEIKRIELDKWYEGTRIKRDPGDPYIMQWINKNSSQFSTEWECSACKTCHKASECGFKTLPECPCYEPNQSH